MFNTLLKIINSIFTGSLIHFQAYICTNHAIFWCFLAAKKKEKYQCQNLHCLSYIWMYREHCVYSSVIECNDAVQKFFSELYQVSKSQWKKWNARKVLTYFKNTKSILQTKTATSILEKKNKHLCIQVIIKDASMSNALTSRTESNCGISFLMWQEYLGTRKLMAAGTDSPSIVKRDWRTCWVTLSSHNIFILHSAEIFPNITAYKLAGICYLPLQPDKPPQHLCMLQIPHNFKRLVDCFDFLLDSCSRASFFLSSLWG